MAAENDGRNEPKRGAAPVAGKAHEGLDEDRRDSPRMPIRLLVRHAATGDDFEPRDGDIGVGGVFFEESAPVPGRRVGLRFRLPGVERELRCEGEIVRVSENGGRFGTHVRFIELDTESELAIARFIDDLMLGRRR